MSAAIVTYALSADYIEPLKNADDASVEVINLASSTVYPAGTIVGEITATPGVYGAYGKSHVDGTQKPTHILQYSVTTDAAGNIYKGAQASSEWGESKPGAPAYRNGYFNVADLVGLDASDTPQFGTIFRLTQGTATAGHIIFYGA